MVEVRRNPPREVSVAAILRIVAVVVASAVAILLVYELRRPLTYLFVAGFLAIALSRPVAFFGRRMRRGFAIATVYLMLLGIPIALGALLIPPIVHSVSNFANNVPHYVNDARNFVHRNRALRHLDKQYDVTGKLEKEAGKLPGKVGVAASTLGSIGATLVSGVFGLLSVLILSAFLLGSGPVWYEGFLALQPAERRDRLRRVLDHSASAISGYVAGALLQATLASVTSLAVLSVLGVPFAAALALVMGFFDLIPVVGATLGAVLIGVFTLFADFPTSTIVWTVYSVVYQQFENSVIQPQIQRRTVNVNGFIVIVSVLCGSTLFGIIGARTAIPIAASIQIGVREWWAYRAEQRAGVSSVSTTGDPTGGPP